MLLILVHPKTKKIKRFEVEWSWTCFMFYYLGIPLFNRLLFAHGFLMLGVWFAMISTRSLLFYNACKNGNCVTLYYSDIILMLMVPASFFYAKNANKMGIKRHLEKGWQIDDSSDGEAKKWAEKEFSPKISI